MMMKKISLIAAAILVSVSLVACGNNSQKAKQESAKVHSEKVEKARKRKLAKKRRKKKKRAAESKKKQQEQQQQSQSQAQQSQQQNNQQATQNSNANTQSTNSNGEQVYTAHPSQGGTIYQTNGNAGSFQGDPDTIAATQEKMEQAAQNGGY